MALIRKSDMAPAQDWAAVTASDSAALDPIPSAIYVGGAGDLAVKSEAGDTVTLVGVTAGSVLPIRPQYVMSTNTTATSIVALW
jgi:hypothetical protein